MGFTLWLLVGVAAVIGGALLSIVKQYIESQKTSQMD